jgi:hypothetical protein
MLWQNLQLLAAVAASITFACGYVPFFNLAKALWDRLL